MKKIILLLVIGLIMVGVVSATEYYVDPTGDDTTGDGSSETPYATIGKAITVAAASGDTINVAAGTYTEDLTIDKQLTIVGADKTTTTIKGIANVHKDNWPLAGPNIDIQADGVIVHGFTIEGPDYLADYYASGLLIDGINVEIYDNNFVTTAAANTDEVGQAITTYSKTAIPTADVSGLNIHDNTITCSGVTGCEGIYINPHTGSGTVTINNNQFSGTILIGISAESGNIDVTNNTIINGGAQGWYGIRFFDTSLAATYENIVITGNTIQNEGSGIRVGNSGAGSSVFSATLSSNTFSDTTKDFDIRNGGSIQDAIDGASAGDIISVAAGTYTEDLTIDKGVTINGADSSTTTINGVHSITANDVTLTGFTFDPNGGIGFTIDASSSAINNININNTIFDLTTGQPIGILVGGYSCAYKVSSITISGNTFNGPDTMISNPWKIGGYFGTAVDCEVDGVTFSLNTVNKGSTPINLQDKNINAVTVYDNIFRNTDGALYVWTQDGTDPIGVLSNFVFSHNDIDSTNSYGVAFFDSDIVTSGVAAADTFDDDNFGTGISINNNKFVDIPGAYDLLSVSILSTLTSYTLDAQNNWWGDASGPTHSTNPDGTGDGVSDNVDFDPWCSDSTCAATADESSSIGFDSSYPLWTVSTVREALDWLFNRAPQDTDGVNIYLHKGWNTFKLPWFVLTGTDQSEVAALALGGNYAVTNVLSSIEGSYSYIAYYDGTWRVYSPGVVENDFTTFPYDPLDADYDFHIYMTAADRLTIE